MSSPLIALASGSFESQKHVFFFKADYRSSIIIVHLYSSVVSIIIAIIEVQTNLNQHAIIDISYICVRVYVCVCVCVCGTSEKM